MQLRKFKEPFCWAKHVKYAFVLLLFSPVFLFAQMKTISGIVTGDDGKPLPGASVKLKNTRIGTLTDEAGKFSINVPENAVLVISSIGYKDQEVMIDAKVVYAITLKPTSGSGLNDVVVVGYGAVKRKDLTGSVSSAPIDDMNKAPVGDVMESLQGRVAGVVISGNDGAPGAAPNITIRGANSITGDNSPLYVIDGVIVENPPSPGGISQNLLGISPEDIESVDVLKDASATAIYGSRGSNGVIVITTKKGKIGAPTLSINAYGGVQKDLKFLSLMNPYQYVSYLRERDSMNNNYVFFNGTQYANAVIQNINGIPTLIPGVHAYLTDSTYLQYGANWGGIDKYKSVPSSDIQRTLYGRTAPMQNYDVSIIGGTDKTKYYMSGNIFDQEGIMAASGYRRYQGRMSMDHTLSKKLKVGLTANYAYVKQWGGSPLPNSVGSVSGNSANGSTTSAGYSPMYAAYSYRPIAPLDINGNTTINFINTFLDSSTYAAGNGATSSAVNPYISQLHSIRNIFNKNFTANAYVEYKITPGLTLRISGGISTNTARTEQFYDSLTQRGASSQSFNGGIANPQGSVLIAQSNTWINDNQLTYDKSFSGGHHLNVIGVVEEQVYTNFATGFSANNIPFPVLGIGDLYQGTVTSFQYPSTSNRLASFLGRVNYDYKSRYYLTASFREDGSSKFASGHRWGFFPSAAFKWRFIDEGFMKNQKILSDGNIRVSYGTTGNNRLNNDFGYLSQLALATTGNGTNVVGGILQQGAYPAILPNTGLTWESTAQTDIGTDLAFLNNRINLTADVYRKITSKLLLQENLPASEGFLAVNANVGKTRNQGLELGINTTNIQSLAAGGFTWTSTFNIAWTQNKVLAVAPGQEILPSSVSTVGFSAQPAYIAKVGQSLGQMYGYVSDGLYQPGDFNYTTGLGTASNYVGVGSHYVLKDNVPYYGSRGNIQPGDLKFKDLNGDGVIDAKDQTVIGRGLPIHTGGFGNNFSYKGFSLNIFFQWSYGNDIINAYRFLLDGGLASGGNQFADYTNRWTPTNMNTDIPRIGGGVLAAPAGIIYSSRMVEDGSYLRLKTVNLTYSIPSFLLKRTGFKSCSVYISGQNLITWTKYTGQDPEVSGYNSVLTPGFDWSAYPRARTYVIGANLSF